MIEKIVVPFAPILVESTRSIGYSFESAVADVIDNSISASATEVRVCFSSLDPQWLCIEDNGTGMNAEELENAMRYGSQSSLDIRRPDDLGRFGLGLKMASLSQCRKVTVMSKQNGKIAAACWDLDYIHQQSEWALKTYTEDEIQGKIGYSWLSQKESGTVVIWEQFDRLRQGTAQARKFFDEKTEISRSHIALVFHRFINDENPKRRLAIYFNGEPVTGIDPFLTRHPATQPLNEQILRIGSDEIKVKPYVLPYLSKLSKEDLEILGGKDELRQQQGFYVYRNRRLIIWGTWFRLIKQDELGKLARVRVDIPNSLDSIWEIDVKKSTASLPHSIKKNLADIVKRTVGTSERVYKYRGRNVQTDNLIHVWNPIDDRGKLQYLVNRELPIIKMLTDHLDDTGDILLDSFIKMLEDAFPFADVYYRMAKNDESSIREPALDNDAVFLIANQMIQQVLNMEGDVNAFLATMDKMDFFIKYPDVIRQIRKVYKND